MTRTFLVAVELPDDADLNAIADDISELVSEQYAVSSVRPWATPTPQLSGAPAALPTILG